MRLGRFFAILLGVNVRSPAGEEKAVACLGQIGNIHEIRVRGHNERQCTGNLPHRFAVHLAASMGRILIIDEVEVSDDANNRPRHFPAFLRTHLVHQP